MEEVLVELSGSVDRKCVNYGVRGLRLRLIGRVGG